MLRLIRFYDKHRKWLFALFVVLILVNLLLMLKVEVNYDLAKYLPADSPTKTAIAELEEDFSYPGFLRVMVEDLDVGEALTMKARLAAVDGVAGVVWLDDYADVNQPPEFLDPQYLREYYRENCALYWVEFTENDYSLLTGQAILDIKEIIGEQGAVSGSAEDSRYMRSVLYTEMTRIALIVVPICVLILMFVGLSWIEPLFYLAVIGVAIALNMGTNVMFGNVSFITQAIAAVLQLAISLDYCLFLMHRYMEEREHGLDVYEALAEALKRSFSAISASALTTIAGFLALLFMRYRLGTDLGLVLAKGIILSFITTITLMPLLILTFRRALERTRHRPYAHNLLRFGKYTVKGRYVMLVLALLAAVPALLAYQNVEFKYGDTSGSAAAGEAMAQEARITSVFGDSEPAMFLIPNDDIAAEDDFCDALARLPYVRMVQGVTTLVGAEIPQEMVPADSKAELVSDRYSRVIAYIELGAEGPLTFSSTEAMQELAEKYFPGEWLMASASTAIVDIRDTVSRDSFVITFVSILAVGLIILLTYRSLALPVILVLVIELSIWINMAIPYFQGNSLVFIGYLVVSSIQLGATIDYAILMSSRYLEFRRTLPPKEAACRSLTSAGTAILTSALILTTAGTAEFIVSEIGSISVIGLLLGRGAALSGFMVLVLLPPLMVICDKVIINTTLGFRKQMQPGAKTAKGDKTDASA